MIKYMSFNSSCSYTCLAILLEEYQINKTDREIALEMKLPYLFHYASDITCYQAGAMLQGKIWFDIFLNPYELEFIEVGIKRKELSSWLDRLNEEGGKAMLGIKMSSSKHAVVFDSFDIETKKWKFINPKSEMTEAYEYLFLSDAELMQFFDETIHLGRIVEIGSKTNVKIDFIQTSLENLNKYKKSILEWSKKGHTLEEQMLAKNTIFRAFLVDVGTMLELINESDVSKQIRILAIQYQKELMTFKVSNNETLFKIELSDEIVNLVDKYIEIIKQVKFPE